MIRVVPFKAEHILELRDQGMVTWLPGLVRANDFEYLEKSPYSKTILDEDGKVLGCGGCNELWKDRAEAWAFLNTRRREKFIMIHRVVKRFFNNCPYRRVEATVDCDFPQGHRWMKLLGFGLEAPRMRFYSLYGSDRALYSKIKDEEG